MKLGSYFQECTLHGLVSDELEVWVDLCMEKTKQLDVVIPSTTGVRNLGILYDSTENVKQQVNSIHISNYAQLRNIGRIICYLINYACKRLINGLVTSRINYCIVLCARNHDYKGYILSNTSCSRHIIPGLKKLH